MTEIQITEKNEKVKRNSLVVSIFCIAAVWFEVDPSKANIWGITSSDKLTTGAVVLISWTFALYHVFHYWLHLHKKLLQYHNGICGECWHLLNEHYNGKSFGKELPWRRHYLITLCNPQVPLDEDQVPDGLHDLAKSKVTWGVSLSISLRQTFLGEKYREPGEERQLIFWVMDVFFPIGAFVIATALVWWFFVASHMPHLPQ